MSKSYGILFSEFGSKKYCVENKIICLNDIRKQLESMYSNKVCLFDIIKVTSHSKNNSYPEIGVHWLTDDISGSDYEQMESFVISSTKNKHPDSEAKNFKKPVDLTWEYINEHGCYPHRT